MGPHAEFTEGRMLRPFCRSTAPRKLSALLVLALLAGCTNADPTGPAMGDVSGRVTYNDKPVANANIVFLPTTKDTLAAAGITDEDGRYRLSTRGVNDGAIVGPFKVTVVARAPYDGPVPEGMSPAWAKETFQHQGKPLIPERYFSPSTSKLTADVKQGANSVDFPLTD